MKRILSAFVIALALAAAGTLASCGGSPTSPSTCNAGPYTFDANVQRCRASNGQFAESVCCGR